MITLSDSCTLTVGRVVMHDDTVFWKSVYLSAEPSVLRVWPGREGEKTAVHFTVWGSKTRVFCCVYFLTQRLQEGQALRGSHWAGADIPLDSMCCSEGTWDIWSCSGWGCPAWRALLGEASTHTSPWCSFTLHPYFSGLAAAVGLILDQMGNTWCNTQ